MIRLPGQLDDGNKYTKYMYLPLLHKATKTSELCRPVSIQHCQTPHLVFEHINLHTNADKMNLFEAKTFKGKSIQRKRSQSLCIQVVFCSKIKPVLRYSRWFTHPDTPPPPLLSTHARAECTRILLHLVCMIYAVSCINACAPFPNIACLCVDTGL